jgi:hypothetical protein
MSAQFNDLPIPAIQYMVDAVFDTVAAAARRSQDSVCNEREAATAALAALQPTDAIEANMAVRIVAAHHGALDNLRRAALPDVGDALAIRLRANAIALSRMAERLTAALEQRQAMGRAARMAAALEASLSTREPATEENCQRDPMPSETVTPEQVAHPPMKPYRIRLEQQKADREAARAARMAGLQRGATDAITAEEVQQACG